MLPTLFILFLFSILPFLAHTATHPYDGNDMHSNRHNQYNPGGSGSDQHSDYESDQHNRRSGNDQHYDISPPARSQHRGYVRANTDDYGFENPPPPYPHSPPRYSERRSPEHDSRHRQQVPTNDPHHDRIPADSGADYGFDHPPPSYSSPPRYSEQLSTERESRNRHRGWRQEDDGETVVYDPYGTDAVHRRADDEEEQFRAQMAQAMELSRQELQAARARADEGAEAEYGYEQEQLEWVAREAGRPWAGGNPDQNDGLTTAEKAALNLMIDSNGEDLSGLAKLEPESQAKLKEIWADLTGTQISGSEHREPESSDQPGELNDLELEILGVMLENPRNAEGVLEVLPDERSRTKVREAWRQMAGETNRGTLGETNRMTAGAINSGTEEETNRRTEGDTNHGRAVGMNRRIEVETSRGSTGDNRGIMGESNHGPPRETNHRSEGDMIRGMPARETNRETRGENETPQSPDSDERRERVRQAWIMKSDPKAREANRRTAEARRTHTTQSNTKVPINPEYVNSGDSHGHRSRDEERINKTHVRESGTDVRGSYKATGYTSSSHDKHRERHAKRNDGHPDFEENRAPNREFVNPHSELGSLEHAKRGSCTVEYDSTCDENRANLIKPSGSQHRAERSGKTTQTTASINPPSTGYRMPGPPIPLPRNSPIQSAGSDHHEEHPKFPDLDHFLEEFPEAAKPEWESRKVLGKGRTGGRHQIREEDDEDDSMNLIGRSGRGRQTESQKVRSPSPIRVPDGGGRRTKSPRMVRGGRSKSPGMISESPVMVRRGRSKSPSTSPRVLSGYRSKSPKHMELPPRSPIASFSRPMLENPLFEIPSSMSESESDAEMVYRDPFSVKDLKLTQQLLKKVPSTNYYTESEAEMRPPVLIKSRSHRKSAGGTGSSDRGRGSKKWDRQMSVRSRNPDRDTEGPNLRPNPEIPDPKFDQESDLEETDGSLVTKLSRISSMREQRQKKMAENEPEKLPDDQEINARFAKLAQSIKSPRQKSGHHDKSQTKHADWDQKK